ncbi:MAG TPA: winged helix DNA-binding domain-containing protein [Actinomycetota bacterium]|nr:winged helix DNA-binding domain-containing protein [Actinomycetota bacterium]
MKALDVSRLRMRRSGLTDRRFETVVDVVRHHGAMQAQEHELAKWSIAQRTRALVDADVDEAIAAGAILRTHVLRPTWHFVAAGDARWLLALTGPRVRQTTAARFRELGLDGRTLARSETAAAAALADGNQLTRNELGDALDAAGIDRSGQRFPHILMHLEIEAVVCSGARRGRNHTYALFDDRVPPARARDRDEAIAELTRRYLAGHGPASVQDLRWWSSLKGADVRKGLDLLGDAVVDEAIDGVRLWSLADERDRPRRTSTPHLLHVYDELVVGYTLSRFFGDPRRTAEVAAWRDRSVPGNVLLVDGRVAGRWRRTIDGNGVRLQVWTHDDLGLVERDALRRAAARLGRFLGRPWTLETAS